MSSTLIFVGLPENSKSSVTKTVSAAETDLQANDLEAKSALDSLVRVPNAPKSCIAEIFSSDAVDSSPMKAAAARPRVVRDTPTRPRDTHSRLFGQGKGNGSVSTPMVTDTIRSNIHFGDGATNGHNGHNGHSPSPSPTKMNGSVASTPSRGEVDGGDNSSYKPTKRNPVTGDGIELPPQRRRHPAAGLREGNPITGFGYKSLNGQINTLTSLNGSSIISHKRVPPGGHSSGLW